MKKESIYLICCLSLALSSCQSVTAYKIARYVGRPNLENPCIANGDGTCYRDGDLYETENMICGPAQDFGDLQTHLESMEFFKWKCKKYGNCK